MSQNFNIENSFEKKKITKKTKLNYQIKKEKPSKMSLNKNINEFDLINSLIEEHLELPESELDESIEENDTLEMKQSYSDPAKIQRERMQRIGLLKSDPTGKISKPQEKISSVRN